VPGARPGPVSAPEGTGNSRRTVTEQLREERRGRAPWARLGGEIGARPPAEAGDGLGREGVVVEGAARLERVGAHQEVSLTATP
jgi:hypothetical protein